jgi:translation initiation factor 4A
MDACQNKFKSYDDFEAMDQFQGPNANIDLLHGITNYGFETPSEIQQQTIVPLYKGKNVIGQAQSGRGKTGAFVIGSLSRLIKEDNHVQIIILANTHELAQQIITVTRELGSKLIKPDKIELCVGRQVSVEENIRAIRLHGAQVLVGTPGRIKHLVTHQIKGVPLIRPASVRTIVLDEADCLLMDKFRDVVVDIIEALDCNRPDPLQLGIFSATFSEDSLGISRCLCVPDMKDRLTDDEWRKDPNAPLEILIPVENLTLDGIEQYYYNIDCMPQNIFDEKTDFLVALNEIQMIPMAIIYVNNRTTAERLKKALDKERMSSQCIYGSMTPNQRRVITKGFRDCETRLLISTDLLARGFDVQQVKLVINFDLPYVNDRNTAEPNKEKMAEYLHRIGRGGRFGRKGMAISLTANATEVSRKESIEAYFDTTINVLPDTVEGLY